MATIVCSACGAAVGRGMAFCPGCGLPLAAQAVPVLERSGPRFSLSQIVVAVAGFGVVALYAGERVEAGRSGETRQAVIAGLNGGNLSTRAQFEARCGHPSETRQLPGGVQADVYGPVLVIFRDQPLPTATLRRDADPDRLPAGMPADPNWALDRLRCTP